MRYFSYKKIVPFILVLLLAVQIFVPSHQPARAQSAALAGVSLSFLECRFSDDLKGALTSSLDKLKEKGGELLNSIGLGEITGRISSFFGNDSDEENNDSGEEDAGRTDNSIPTGITYSLPDAEKTAKNCASASFKRALIRAAVQDVLDYVRSGDKKRFIQDYGDEFKQAASGAAANVVRDITGADICSPFRAQFEAMVNRTTFPSRYNRFDCTIGEVIDLQSGALEAFYDDFRNGGWNAWRVLHRPENNPLGFYLKVNDRRLLALEESRQETGVRLATSNGFSNEFACTEAEYIFEDGTTQMYTLTPEVLMSKWSAFVEQQRATNIDIAVVTCATNKIITPSSVIADQVNNAVDSERENLVQTDSFYEIVRTIISTATSDILRNGL